MQAQTTKMEQECIVQQAANAQKMAQSTATISQQYEERLSELRQKMGQLENLLISQRQKSSALDSELSAVQDYMRESEHRAKLLEDENVRI